MTAEEFLRSEKHKLGLRSQSAPLGTEGLESESLIEFAQHHVKVALEAAKNIADDFEGHEDMNQAILESYPLNLIK